MKNRKGKIVILGKVNDVDDDMELTIKMTGKLTEDEAAQGMARCLCSFIAQNEGHCTEAEFAKTIREIYREELQNCKEGER